jgi:hypothetical protein
MEGQIMSRKIKPEPPERQDFDRIEREYGPLPAHASAKEIADRYRDAQAARLIRLYAKERAPHQS